MTEVDPEAWQRHKDRLDARQAFRNFELCRRGPDGERWIRSSGVPVFDAQNALVAVLDIDSHEPAAFDDTDRAALERIVELLRPCFDTFDSRSA